MPSSMLGLPDSTRIDFSDQECFGAEIANVPGGNPNSSLPSVFVTPMHLPATWIGMSLSGSPQQGVTTVTLTDVVRVMRGAGMLFMGTDNVRLVLPPCAK
mmetsp:Transcript_70843/g.171421  ORF Transcript_70843/g.171421 Transcript_70843/m.171421 type:complete len:100 (-) Transcript_70843:1098-1397(-)